MSPLLNGQITPPTGAPFRGEPAPLAGSETASKLRLGFGEQAAVVEVAVATSAGEEECGLGTNNVEHLRGETEARVLKLANCYRLQLIEPHHAIALERATASARQQNKLRVLEKPDSIAHAGIHFAMADFIFNAENRRNHAEMPYQLEISRGLRQCN